MISTRIFFQIHYSRRLLIIYWINDFLSGNLVSFCTVSSAFKLLPYPDSVLSFVWSRYRVFFFGNWISSTRLLAKQADYQLRLHELYRGPGRGMLPGKNFGKLDSLKRHILHSLDLTQLIYTCILLSFSQSLVIHDSQVFKTKIHDSYMFCKYDSWFRFHPRFCKSEILILFTFA